MERQERDGTALASIPEEVILGGVHRGIVMICKRCSGYMVEECFYVPDEIEMTVHGWRCLNCGEVIDGTILHNRRTTVLGPLRLFCRRGDLGSPIPVRLSPLATRPPRSRSSSRAGRRRRPVGRAR